MSCLPAFVYFPTGFDCLISFTCVISFTCPSLPFLPYVICLCAFPLSVVRSSLFVPTHLLMPSHCGFLFLYFNLSRLLSFVASMYFVRHRCWFLLGASHHFTILLLSAKMISVCCLPSAWFHVNTTLSVLGIMSLSGQPKFAIAHISNPDYM